MPSSPGKDSIRPIDATQYGGWRIQGPGWGVIASVLNISPSPPFDCPLDALAFKFEILLPSKQLFLRIKKGTSPSKPLFSLTPLWTLGAGALEIILIC